MFLFPFDIPGKKYTFSGGSVLGQPYNKGVLKVFDSSFRKDGIISTLFSKALIIGIFFGTILFTPIGIFQILKIVDVII